MGQVDLHLHSTASDGRFSPAEIVAMAAERGLSVIALTDHDTVNGITPALEAARAFPNLKVIPAVELSTDVPRGEAHVLGYFIDYAAPEFKAALDRFRNSRVRRAQGMVAKLKDLGIPIEWQRVQEIAADSSIGRPHIARAMLEKGYITSFKEAFTKYISRDGPAYVEREKVTPSEAVELILKASGLPVLAHPFTVGDAETMIIELNGAGLVGIEAYYNSYSANDINTLTGWAGKHNLIATGGSDFHGLDLSTETPIGGAEVPMESAEQLFALARQRGIIR
ncbi:MAG TPA: PHP domain-containing protein [Dehalococcoidia bacterium]|nr:PHP domain-containing protein [Dehalococcoidia bacterium]